MASKRPSGKQSKGKKGKLSPAKKSVTTVTALFKKQFLQQEARNTNNVDSMNQDSDNEDIVCMKEETASQHFISKKSQNRSIERDLSEGGDSEHPGKESQNCGKDGTGATGESTVDGSQRRPSRRLSLKKASQEKINRLELKSSASSASSNLDSSHVSKVVHNNRTVLANDTDGNNPGGSSSVDRLSELSVLEEDDKTCISDTVPTDPSRTGKLSLKRKRTSQDSSATSPSPKVARSGSITETLTDSYVGNPPRWLESGDLSSRAPVFSIFKPSSEQVKSVCDTDSSQSSIIITCEGPQTTSSECKESPTASFSELNNNEIESALRQKYAAFSSGREAKNRAKDKVSASTSKTNVKSMIETEGEKETEGLKEEQEEEALNRVPYYLENFNTIMKSVLADDYYIQLFNEMDLKHVAEYNNLSETSQKLYVRLFSRKLAWLPAVKIKYPEIADDLTPCLDALVKAQLLSSGEELDDLSALLGAMSVSDLRVLAKSYHVNPIGQQKGQIIQTLITKSQQSTVASLFGQKVGGVKEAMLNRAKKQLGPVYRLYREPRGVFVRAMMLFSLINTNGDEDNGSGGQGQLFQMLLVNMGRVVYPTYIVNRQTHIFRCRQDLIRFEEALQLETVLLGYTTTGNWKGAYASFLTVRDSYEQLIKDNMVTEWDSRLPEFLRPYTAGSVLVRLLNQGIEILQRRKEYTVAVDLIHQLLRQTVYNSYLRGYWWDRLALNLDVHLKQQEQALQAMQDGLADPLVRTGHRLSLYLRAEGICTKPKSPFSQRLKDFVHEPLTELPKTYVDGRVLPHTLPGSRYQFITNTWHADCDAEEVTVCNVEQIVLDHYRVHGFPQGIHAEGSVVSILFCLYFWETLFMDVADAFYGPYQTSPLDLHTDAFYQRRQKAIDDRLVTIENGDEETLRTMLGATWELQSGVMCAGINWEKFISVGDVQGLVSCMGGKVLAAILRRYAQQPRHTRGGFPDLTLWNTSTKQLKISEVKGPGDRLSHKQMLWLDYLLKMGVDAEVCHVRPVGVKKLKPVSKQESESG